MDSITKLKKTYTRNQLYNYCKVKKIEKCSKLRKHDLAKIIVEYLQKNKVSIRQLYNFDNSIFSTEKPDQRYNQFKFDNSIFSTDKPDQKYNQFKFEESIFSTDKPIQEIPRKLRDIEVREGTTRNWHNMVHDYEIYCESEKNDLIRFLSKVSEKLYEIAKKEMKIKNSISFQLVAVVDYTEINLLGERVDNHRRHFRSTNHIIVHSNAIKSALISAKNEVIRNFDGYNARNTRYRFDRVI
jgi:hypothetical protein